MATATITEQDGWLCDERGNRNRISYYGSREAAEKALLSLIDCGNCINCSRCSRCSRCSDCSGCSRCSDCSRCSRCSDCSRCSRCSRCSDCSGCSGLYLQTGLTALAPGEANAGPPPVPVIPDIHAAIYAAASQPEALDMGHWHTCENTHCRAGWVVHRAGPEGKALERFYGTALAAMMIYDASDPTFKISPARFFETNDAALADMKRLAEQAPA